jgi:hypothetical protein
MNPVKHTIMCRLEFGLLNGERAIAQIPTLMTGAKLAADLVRVFTNSTSDVRSLARNWRLKGSTPRIRWQSPTHFVVLTRLDGRTNFPIVEELPQ